MTTKILARAIAAICARNEGLFKITLPRSLGPEFKASVCSTVTEHGGFAVAIGNGPGEMSPGEAIAYRTPEQGDSAKTVLLIATEGQTKELKSLETFRDVLAGGMPGGLQSGSQAILQGDAVAQEIAKLVTAALPGIIDKGKLTEVLCRVLSYIAKAYSIHGNDEKRWTDAFWRHVDIAVDNLLFGAGKLQTGTPNFERNLVYACAGLPRPNRGDSFAPSNDAAKYVKVVAADWANSEKIDLSLIRIQEENGAPDETHPLRALRWQEFVTSRTGYGHPVLAVAFHGSETREEWLHGWASTSEKGFFAAPSSSALEYDLLQVMDGREVVMPPAGYKGLDYVLPQMPNALLAGNVMSLGRYKLRIAVDASAIPAEPPVELIPKPASACKVKVLGCLTGTETLEVEFELERKLPAKSGKWREKPFTLSVAPSKVVSESSFRESFALALFVPNPAAPSLFVLEQAKRGGVSAPLFLADAIFCVNKQAGWIESDATGAPRSIALSEGAPSARVVVVGARTGPVFEGVSALVRNLEHHADWIQTFDLPSPPEDVTIVVDDVYFLLSVPSSENGEVNPVLAAIRGVPVSPNDDKLEGDIKGDPRGDLEVWLRDNVIAAPAGDEVRQCFGCSLLEIGSSRSSRELLWNSGLGTFTNCERVTALHFPAELARSPAAERFWTAFDDLDLASCAGEHDFSALPSMLDLRKLPKEKLETYLAAYADLLDTLGDPKLSSWAAYPFSSLLFDTSRGQAEGILLSPLHPIRMAWCWSVQASGSELAASKAFEKVALSFLRFIDGEMFPAAGPATHGSARWLATGLSAGPREIFVGWSLLSNMPMDARNHHNAIRLLGLDLPFGTPSGLDQGGVSAALRDYLRVFPAAQQLRIGLAAPRGGFRFAETDEAIIAAAGNLLAQRETRLPGGIRIIDASDRRGARPDPTTVLDSMQSENAGIGGLSMPPFEWHTENPRERKYTVDLQFVEDSVVNVETNTIHDQAKVVGTCGPGLPVNRFRSWQMEYAINDVSSFALAMQDGAFSGLNHFASALGKLEQLQVDGAGVRVQASLQMGTTLLGEHANWTISGNRHLNPSVLSAQLGRAKGEVALWEWRPAFLSRQRQKTSITSIAATHPYTVFARPSLTLTDEIERVLHDCGISYADDDVRQVITNLGIRGVGLSSLLTMGHTQSLGALGFNLAFRGLMGWERAGAPGEVRCVVPMDSVYPLLDLLGEDSATPDDQQRADLLLVSSSLQSDGTCAVRLHPVEVKMRSKDGATFPPVTAISDPIGQLKNTFLVLESIAKNIDQAGEIVLLRSALASLLEAAFLLRPVNLGADAKLEAEVLGAVAARPVNMCAERGTILWFQAGGATKAGSLFDLAFAEGNIPGCVFINPVAFNSEASQEHVQAAIANVVDHVVELTEPSPRTSPNERAPAAETSPGEAPEKEPVGCIEKSNQPRGEAEPRTANEAVPNSAPDPSAPTGIEILIGEEARGAKLFPVVFKPSETALNQLNIGVVGDLGTGKTQFLKSLVYQIAGSGPSNRGVPPKVFLFDYKRDYSESEFPEALGAQVLDPSKAPLPINFFAIDVDHLDSSIQMERVRRANFFCDLLRRISRIGIVQRNELYSCVMRAYVECPTGHFPTINDVFDSYAQLGKSDSVVSTLTMLRDLAVFETDSTKTKTFVELFDRSTVLNLAGLGGAGQDIVDIVATMFLDNLYTDYMKTRPKPPFITGDDGVSRRQVDSFVLIDEAHHAMGREFDVLMKLMLEGREFGMGVILSSQYLSHFEGKSHDWAEALSTWVVHNVRNASPKQFERIGFRSNLAEMAENVAALQTHWAYFRCVNGFNEGILMKGQPFFSLER